VAAEDRVHPDLFFFSGAGYAYLALSLSSWLSCSQPGDFPPLPVQGKRDYVFRRSAAFPHANCSMFRCLSSWVGPCGILGPVLESGWASFSQNRLRVLVYLGASPPLTAIFPLPFASAGKDTFP